MGAVTALAIIALAIAGCQDGGTDSSIDDLTSVPALPSAAGSIAP